MKGHVRERGRGNWYAVLSIRDPQTGKRKVRFHSLPDCKTKRDAQTACAKLLTETSSAPHISTSKTTLREWVEHWVSIGCPGSKRRKEVGNAQSSGMPNCCAVMSCQPLANGHCSGFNPARSIIYMFRLPIKSRSEPCSMSIVRSARVSARQCEQARSPKIQ